MFCGYLICFGQSPVTLGSLTLPCLQQVPGKRAVFSSSFTVFSSCSTVLIIRRFWIFTNPIFLFLCFFFFFRRFLLDVFSSGVWASLADLREPSLTGLVSRLQSTVIASRAPGTTDAYRRAFTRWKNFASSVDEIQVFPVRTDNLLNLRNVCIFLLAFAVFFRIEEVLHIKYGDITFLDTYVAIKVDRSKTDQLRKGNEVVISRTSSQDACPVSIFKRYVSELERFPVEPSHYVFKPLTKSKLGHKFVSTNKPISYSTVREYFKSSFKDIVPDIAAFSTHSLRAGGASAAANAGVADRLFQRHGRWKSVSAKNGYIDDNLESRLLVSQRLGI